MGPRGAFKSISRGNQICLLKFGWLAKRFKAALIDFLAILGQQYKL